MFENLLNQDATKALISDIRKNVFPSSVLFSGNAATGKLTAALEVARILSCSGPDKGNWLCKCPSCQRHRGLTCTNVFLMGPRDCSLEIAASKNTFIKAYRDNAPHVYGTRYLFIRSIRKLTLRFSEILLKGEDNVSKISAVLEDINEKLELLDFPRELPVFEEVVKICDDLEKNCQKLEKDYLYKNIPINQIRNMEEWARIKSDDGKKTVIIENADKMQVSVRNALLKILEEPPADCVFILITTNRNAVMETILSRVRNYNFKNRSLEGQQEIIKLVFHNEYFNGEIYDYMQSFLPVPAAKIKEQAVKFYKEIISGSIPETGVYIKECGDFSPKMEFQIFLETIAQYQRRNLNSPAGCEAAKECLEAITKCWENVTMYNQSINAALEILVRDISKINVIYGKILCVGM